FDEGFVGPAVFRRHGDRDLQRAVVLADDPRLAGVRLRPDRQHIAFGMLADRDHAAPPGMVSKRTVPKRTSVAPSSTATSKSLLMPMERCRMACGGDTSRASRSRSLRTNANVGRHCSASAASAAIVIRTAT